MRGPIAILAVALLLIAGGAAFLIDDSGVDHLRENPAPRVTTTPALRPAVGHQDADELRPVRFTDGRGREACFELCVSVDDGVETVPGAEVFLLDHDAADVDLSTETHAPTTESFEKRGIRRVTDARGYARFRWAGSRMWLFTRHGDRAAITSRPWFDDSVSLTLLPRSETLVRVVDGAGDPVAGVPVAIAQSRSVKGAWPGEYGYQMRSHRVTGADGVAVFTERAWFRGADDDRAEYATFGFPMRYPSEVEVRDRGATTLVLPETGRVVVELVSERGEIMDVDGTAELAVVTDLILDRHRVRMTGGRAVFAHVGCGSMLAAFADLPDHPGLSLAIAALKPGEERTVRIEVPTPRIVSGRIVDTAGLPIPQLQAGLVLDTGSKQEGIGAFTTDAAGRFRVALDATDASPLRVGIEPDHGPVAWERTDPGRTSHDLGDVVLPGWGLLASGVVVDETGRPVSGEGVSAQILESTVTTEPEPMPLPDGMEAEAHVSVPTTTLSEQWTPHPSAHVATDSNGRFELRGAPGSGPFRLTLSGIRCHLPTPVRFNPGARELRVETRRRRTIEGKVLLPPDVPPGRFVVGVEAFDYQPLRVRIANEDGFVFRIGVSDPGTHLRVHIVGSGTCVASASVREFVQDGAVFDLRTRLRAARIRVVDAAGRPIESAHVQLDAGQGGMTDDGGHAAFVIGASTFGTVRIDANGFRSCSVRLHETDQTIVMRRGIPARFRIAAPPHHAPLQYVVTALREARETQSTRCPADGTAVIHLPAAGTYALGLRVRSGDEEFGLPLKDDRLTVTETSNVLREIEVTEEMLHHAGVR